MSFSIIHGLRLGKQFLWVVIKGLVFVKFEPYNSIEKANENECSL